MPASLRELQSDACATLAAATDNTTAAGDRVPDETAALLQQVGGLLCDGAKASREFDLASLAPAAEALASDGLQGLAAAGDQLLGTGGALADAARGLSNGTITSAQDLAPALERLTSGLLSGPNSDAAANWLADLLAGVKRWLDTPLRPVLSSGSTDRDGGSAPDLGKLISSIADGISGNGGSSTDRDAGAAPDLGKLISGIAGSISGSGDGEGVSTGSEAGDAALQGVGDTISSLVSALTGGGSSGERGGAANATTPGDILNQIVGTIGGALGQEGLQGVDVPSLLPVVGAVLRDPQSRGELPGELGGGGCSARAPYDAGAAQ